MGKAPASPSPMCLPDNNHQHTPAHSTPQHTSRMHLPIRHPHPKSQSTQHPYHPHNHSPHWPQPSPCPFCPGPCLMLQRHTVPMVAWCVCGGGGGGGLLTTCLVVWSVGKVIDDVCCGVECGGACWWCVLRSLELENMPTRRTQDTCTRQAQMSVPPTTSPLRVCTPPVVQTFNIQHATSTVTSLFTVRSLQPLPDRWTENSSLGYGVSHFPHASRTASRN